MKTVMAVKKAVTNIYARKGIVLNYYECPICLDFHLTKNPNALKVEIDKSFFLNGWGRKSTERILIENSRKMMRHFQEWRKQFKKKGMKAQTLPLAEQQKALAKLSTPPPQPPITR